jgi:hypothetical protein
MFLRPPTSARNTSAQCWLGWGNWGAAMSTIIAIVDLLCREYFKRKLGEMDAIPHLPAGK